MGKVYNSTIILPIPGGYYENPRMYTYVCNDEIVREGVEGIVVLRELRLTLLR